MQKNVREMQKSESATLGSVASYALARPRNKGMPFTPTV